MPMVSEAQVGRAASDADARAHWRTPPALVQRCADLARVGRWHLADGARALVREGVTMTTTTSAAAAAYTHAARIVAGDGTPEGWRCQCSCGCYDRALDIGAPDEDGRLCRRCNQGACVPGECADDDDDLGRRSGLHAAGVGAGDRGAARIVAGEEE